MFSWLKHFIISIFPPPSWQGRFTRFFQCLFSLTCTCKGLNWRGLDEGTVSEVWVTLRVLEARWSTRYGRQGRAVDLIFGSVKLEGKSGHLLWRSQDGPRSGSYSLTWRVWALESQEVRDWGMGVKIHQRAYCFPFAFAFPSPCSSQLYFLEGKSKIKSNQSSVSFHEPILSVCHL